MGISTDAKLMVGFNYNEIPKNRKEEFNEMIDDGTLDVASPWYDSDRQHWVVGLPILTNDDEGVELPKLVEIINESTAKFFALTGIKGKIFVSPNVT